MGDKWRVIIVDDEILLLESLEIILSERDGIVVVGLARNGFEALELLQNTEADLALVDLKMDGMGGVELIRNIKEKYPAMKALVLTTFYDVKDIAGAIQNGADSYVLKGGGRETVFSAIENVMAGRGVIDDKVLRRLADYMAHSKSHNLIDMAFSGLTNREVDVCAMVAKGYDNEQIAKSLFISERTVKNYISKIYNKTGVSSRTKLALLFIEHSKP